MAWTYSGDPSKSAKDAVRFMIGDTNPSEPLLHDGEINYLLSTYNNPANTSAAPPLNVAIVACEMIAAKFARLFDESVGPVRQQVSQRRTGYLTLRDELRRRLAIEGAAPYAGGISNTDKQTQEQSADRVEPDFTKHQMENNQIASWTSGSDPTLGNTQ